MRKTLATCWCPREAGFADDDAPCAVEDGSDMSKRPKKPGAMEGGVSMVPSIANLMVSSSGDTLIELPRPSLARCQRSGFMQPWTWALRDLQRSQARLVLAPHWQRHSRVCTAQEGHLKLMTCLRTCTARSMIKKKEAQNILPIGGSDVQMECLTAPCAQY